MVRSHPGRILAVYIRDVTQDARDREIVTLSDRVRARDVEMVLVADSAQAAEHAASHGLIPSAALDDVRRDAARDADPPDAVEGEVAARVQAEEARHPPGPDSAPGR